MKEWFWNGQLRIGVDLCVTVCVCVCVCAYKCLHACVFVHPYICISYICPSKVKKQCSYVDV